MAENESKNLEKAFESLEGTYRGRKKTAIIKANFSLIMSLKEKGYTHKVIVDCLNAYSFDISIRVFETILYRIMKQNKESPAQPIATTPNTKSPMVVYTSPHEKPLSPADIRNKLNSSQQVPLDDEL